MNYQISPSLMCLDMMKVPEQLSFLDEKADMFHVDIMDGHYVKNIALSVDFVRQIKPFTSIPIDIHLMVAEPMDFIDNLIEAGADSISVHAEVISSYAFRLINHVRSSGKKVGIVLNPATPIEVLNNYAHLVDKVTVMTVDPGYAGQPFIPEMVEKIKKLKQFREEGNYQFLIEVDGSCNKNTYNLLLNAGAEVLIMGSSGLLKKDMPLSDTWQIMQNDIVQSLSA
ncbi:D-allulose 6-phosphate 3-epimerase [Vibrio crassostreae]|uniref:D-allulose 6-phosphate 3-epimerase n=1 Tax=Vibrio crassostreae TaxID=246167 RepID=UPI001047FF99|nr:D-allulose 6-phosphate 3-epimerase [Vibrio crassostreae]TCW20136.1 D-allulose-6-phosphate 3-epimerase [Vibrio crassostreae]CAK3290319.1 D-allulose-6-phosphate 3-epimerase [Vibrio crassostreae]